MLVGVFLAMLPCIADEREYAGESVVMQANTFSLVFQCMHEKSHKGRQDNFSYIA
jgi:hypothetical protein